MPPKKKVQEEEVLTGEQDTPESKEPKQPEEAPVKRPVRVRNGTVVLRYHGESPIKAVQNVPSGASYKINNQGLVVVYPQDADFLLDRGGFTEALPNL